MSERATIAAIVLLLAAGGLMQATSPAVRALVGDYVAVEGAGAVRHYLSMGSDSSVVLRTVTADGRGEPVVRRGAWIANGATIQLTLADQSDPAGAAAMMLEQKDGALVVSDLEGGGSRFAGLRFSRTEAELPVSDSKTAEKP